MKAVAIHAYGGPENLRVVDTAVPEPADDEILVEVHAAGVNPVDWKIREGHLRTLLDFNLPLIPGWEAAGIVMRTGRDVTGFRRGDAVWTRSDIRRDGCYAEYLAVAASHVAPKPTSLTFVEAASMPLVGLTAWQALEVFAGIRDGQRVLVHAGSGGVGSFAIQLAKARGCFVAATCSTANVGFVRDLGADHVVDYTRSDFERELHDYDVVFDTLGGDIYLKSFRVLRRDGGTIVSILEQPRHDLAAEIGARCGYVFVQPDGGQLRAIGELVEQGAIRPVVTDVFPLEEAAAAQELSRSGHHRGKIVLRVKDQAVLATGDGFVVSSSS